MTLLTEFLGLDPAQNAFASFLLAVTLRGTLLMGVAAGALFIARRSSAAVRHRLWALTAIGLLILPLAMLTLPGWRIPLSLSSPSNPAVIETNAWGGQLLDPEIAAGLFPDEPANHLATAESAETSNAVIAEAAPVPAISTSSTTTGTGGWGRWLVMVWAGGAAVMGLLSLISLASASRLVRRAQPLVGEGWSESLLQAKSELGVTRSVDLRRCDRAISPMTWGHLRPVILLPIDCESWSADCRRAVMLHEMAHIRRGDWLWQMLVQLVSVLYWFHPLQWLISREVRQESDRAADDMALEAGMRPSIYAEQLVRIAGSLTSEWLHPAPTMARRGQLTRRVGLLLDSRRNRRGIGRQMSWATLIVGLCLIQLLATLSVSFAEEETAKPETVEAPPEVKPAEMTPRDHIEAALRSATEVDFADQPLVDVREYLSELHNIPIIFDEVAMNDVGISTDTPVTLNLGGVTLDMALRLMLEPLQLEAIVEDDVLKITTTVVASETFETRVYDLKRYFGDQVDEILHQWLRSTIMMCVSPESWKETNKETNQGALGGIAKANSIPLFSETRPPAPKSLQIVHQTAKTHRELEELLRKMARMWRPDHQLGLTVSEKNAEKAQDTFEKRKVEIDFADQPLVDIVDYLKELLNIPMINDEVSMNAEGISPDSPMTFKISNISCKNALKLILDPYGLEAVPYGEVILITTQSRAESMHTVRLYNIADLELSGTSAMIKSVVQPDGWTDQKHKKGDLTTLIDDFADGHDKILVVRQTERGHKDVEALLEQLRRLNR